MPNNRERGGEQPTRASEPGANRSTSSNQHGAGGMDGWRWQSAEGSSSSLCYFRSGKFAEGPRERANGEHLSPRVAQDSKGRSLPCLSPLLLLLRALCACKVFLWAIWGSCLRRRRPNEGTNERQERGGRSGATLVRPQVARILFEFGANPDWPPGTVVPCRGSKRKIVKFSPPFQPRLALLPLPLSSSPSLRFFPVADGFPPLGKIVWSIEGTIPGAAAIDAYLNVNDVLA